ncbi:MAG: FAD-dependent oxidoreductase, partial [Ekhidna sp.]
DSSFLLPTFMSSLATLQDKLKVFQLKQRLQKKDIHEIFEKEEQTTHTYLENLGFSSKVINSFFKPFFSGIFLEPDLKTSSRMFEFVYKMFGAGTAMIPKSGMGAIPLQLAGSLEKSELRLNTKVRKVTKGKILLENGEELSSDFIIVATDPKNILANYTSSLKWKSCDNLYFTVKKRSYSKPIIGLNTNPSSLVNNIFFSSSILMKSKGNEELLSVTVVKDHTLAEEELVKRVKEELTNDFQINDVTFLKKYTIPLSLPDIDDLKDHRDAGESLLTEGIAIAGDHLLNGSLNAAMLSGERAAEMADRALAESVVLS